MLDKIFTNEDDISMPSKPREYVRGDPELLQQVVDKHGVPDYVIEDATSSMNLPPADSSEVQDFLSAIDSAVKDLKQGQEQNGHNGSPES